MSDDKEYLDNLVKERYATQAIQKLHRKPLAISICRQVALLDTLELDLASLEDKIKDAKDSDEVNDLNAFKEKLVTRLEEVKKDTIDGVLYPLTYREANDVKAFVTEALVHFDTFKFDTSVKMARIIAEEKFATVFFVLKRKDSKAQYFQTLDEVCTIDDVTLISIYNTWYDHFVLSDEEIKN